EFFPYLLIDHSLPQPHAQAPLKSTASCEVRSSSVATMASIVPPNFLTSAIRSRMPRHSSQAPLCGEASSSARNLGIDSPALANQGRAAARIFSFSSSSLVSASCVLISLNLATTALWKLAHRLLTCEP